MKKYLNFIAWLLVGSAISYFCVVNYGVSIAEVSGPSMEPTFHDMDKVLVNRWTLLWRNPVKGEAVIVWQPKDNTYDIKRIAAVPGDALIPTNGTNRYVLNKNQYFILGDNSNNSWDSRYYGPVHRLQILGVVK